MTSAWEVQCGKTGQAVHRQVVVEVKFDDLGIQPPNGLKSLLAFGIRVQDNYRSVRYAHPQT